MAERTSHTPISILSLALFVATSLGNASSVFAQTPTPPQTVCPPVYGGGTICQDTNIIIDKKVKDPKTGDFVNNVDLNQTPFTPGDHVFFRIFVTNMGNTQLKNITIQDNLPQYITVINNPGSYDGSQRRITISVDSLNANETKSYDIEVAISPLEGLNGTGTTFCLSNQAVAKVDTHQAQDTTQICVQKTPAPQNQIVTKGGLIITPTPTIPANTKGGLPVYQQQNTAKTPSTGAEALLLPLFGAAGGYGVFLRRKAQKNS